MHTQKFKIGLFFKKEVSIKKLKSVWINNSIFTFSSLSGNNSSGGCSTKYLPQARKSLTIAAEKARSSEGSRFKYIQCKFSKDCFRNRDQLYSTLVHR